MGQGQLQLNIVMGAHKIFHDLHKHAGGVVLQGRVRGVQHLVVQPAQGLQPLVGAACLQAFKQHDDRACHAQAVVRGHFNNAVRVQACFRLRQGVVLCAGRDEVVHHLDEFVVLQIEQQGRVVGAASVAACRRRRGM